MGTWVRTFELNQFGNSVLSISRMTPALPSCSIARNPLVQSCWTMRLQADLVLNCLLKALLKSRWRH